MGEHVQLGEIVLLKLLRPVPLYFSCWILFSGGSALGIS